MRRNAPGTLPPRERLPLACLACFLAAFAVLQVAIVRMDPPGGLLTWSSDLLTDQGFHTKAAQLWIKFGHWTLPYTMDFRPASPLFNALMGGLFLLFGLQVATVSGYAIAVSVALLALGYAIARRIFPPWGALAVTVGYGLCFPVFCFARIAIIEPTAILLSLLAVLFYARGPGLGSLCAALGFAGLAFMTKVHFLAIVLAVAIGWLLDIRRLPAHRRRAHLAALGLTLLAITAIAALYLHAFAAQVADFRATVSASIAGALTPRRLLAPLIFLRRELAAETRLPVMLLLIMLYPLAVLWRGRGRRTTPRGWLDALSAQPRAVLILALWAVIGAALTASLAYRPTRYVLFLIYPLIVLGGLAAARLAPRWPGRALGAALALTLLSQVPLYRRWLAMPDSFSKQQAYRDAVGRIERGAASGVIPVVGQEAAELGLRSRRIMPLELDFVPRARYDLCRRLSYWKPRFYVRVQQQAAKEQAALSACPHIRVASELARYRVLDGYKGDFVLYRLSYGS